MIHHRRRLGRCPKACDRSSRRLEALQEPAKLGLNPVDVASEGAKALRLVEPEARLQGQRFADRAPDFPGPTAKLGDAPQRVAMGRNALGLDQLHTMSREEANKGPDRMIGK